MSKENSGSLETEGAAALAHMQQALDLLDTLQLPVEVGAHLDLALCRLRDVLDGKSTSVWTPSGGE